MLMGRLLAPAAVPGSTVAWNEKMLSPATTSPWVPSSKNDCPAAPPIDVRSPDTVSPVLAGPVPGVTATVSSVDEPAATLLGLAAPIPLGLVEPPQAFGAAELLRGLGTPAAKSA